MSKLTHFNDDGKAHMVDVSTKASTAREAIAECYISMNKTAFEHMMAGTAKKGDVLGTARLAGIMAAKQTANLIPLCHPLPISKAAIEFDAHENDQSLRIEALVKTNGQTGVEMEALMAANVTALTVYDMLKAVDKAMVVSGLRLISKSGGKSGDYKAAK